MIAVWPEKDDSCIYFLVTRETTAVPLEETWFGRHDEAAERISGLYPH